MAGWGHVTLVLMVRALWQKTIMLRTTAAKKPLPTGGPLPLPNWDLPKKSKSSPPCAKAIEKSNSCTATLRPAQELGYEGDAGS